MCGKRTRGNTHEEEPHHGMSQSDAPHTRPAPPSTNENVANLGTKMIAGDSDVWGPRARPPTIPPRRVASSLAPGESHLLPKSPWPPSPATGSLVFLSTSNSDLQRRLSEVVSCSPCQDYHNALKTQFRSFRCVAVRFSHTHSRIQWFLSLPRIPAASVAVTAAAKRWMQA